MGSLSERIIIQMSNVLSHLSAEKIAEIEKGIRRNANVTDRNADMFFEDALAEMDTDDFVNGDEQQIDTINADNYDGDPFGDERDRDEYDNDD